jgi:hypothetical protein
MPTKLLLVPMGKSTLPPDAYHVAIYRLCLDLALTSETNRTSRSTASPASLSDQTVSPESHSAAQSDDPFSARLESIFGNL